MENVTKEKKKLTPLILIVIAVVLIGTGIVLIATGNNKSFVVRKNNNTNNEEEQSPKRNNDATLTDEKIFDLLETEINKEYENENWTLGEATILAYSNQGVYLIKFDKIYETNTETIETIIARGEDGWYVELPGWPEGSTDLSQYNFVYYVDKTEEPANDETPVGQPDDDLDEEPIEDITIIEDIEEATE